MGQLFSNLLENLWRGKLELRVMMVGLDGAGKTTVLYKLKPSEAEVIIPTIGFNCETLDYKNIRFTVYDFGGQTKLQPLWRCFFWNTKAIIYVVDSTDRERIDESKEVLHRTISEYTLCDTGAVLLVFGNKQDLPNAMNIAELTDALDLKSFPPTQRWTVQSTCATTGEGLDEGLNWLSVELNK